MTPAKARYTHALVGRKQRYRGDKLSALPVPGHIIPGDLIMHVSVPATLHNTVAETGNSAGAQETVPSGHMNII